MALSTRNRLPSGGNGVVKGEAAAKVSLRVGENHMVALITRESADELGLEAGQQVMALIKATDVMIMTTRASRRNPEGKTPLAPVLTHKDATGWIRVAEKTSSRPLVNRGNLPPTSTRHDWGGDAAP
jgi:molybdate transport system regulatory protein